MSQSIVKPAISASILVAADKNYNPRDSNSMKRGLYQFGSSFMGSSLEQVARNVVPTADAMYLKPLAVASAFTALSAVIDKQSDSKWLKYNFITSALSEVGASYLDRPVSRMISATGSQPPSITVAPISGHDQF